MNFIQVVSTLKGGNFLEKMLDSPKITTYV